MPTLSTKTSEATDPTKTATTNEMIAVVSSHGNNIGAIEPVSTSATITTTPADLSNAGSVLNHNYHHPPASYIAPNTFENIFTSTETPMVIAVETAITNSVLAAGGVDVSSVSSGLATFNGNSNLNLANGSSQGNTNNNNVNSIEGCSSGSGIVKQLIQGDIASASPPSSIQSSLPQLGNILAAPSVNNQGNCQHYNYNNNTNASNTNSNGIINSILKGSKENILQSCYNGAGANNFVGTEVDPDGLGPLPPKWETAYTERGELYFIDHNTGTSHWLDPRLSKFQKKSLEDCGDDELPYGWEKIEDSLYGTYYIDHVNRRTQYENPVLEAKRRAVEQRQKQQQQQPPSTHENLQIKQIEGNQQLNRPQTPSTLNCSNIIDADDSNRDKKTDSNSMVGYGTRLGMQNLPLVKDSLTLPQAQLQYKFTRNPDEMQGERITASLVKSARGLGITIVGGDDGAEEFLQIKSIVPHGPAWVDGQLQTGDVLVYVNDTCVLGFTHHEMVNIFQSILPGNTAKLEVCRGYPLPFDPNDPNTEVVTTIAVDGVNVAATDKQRRKLLDLQMDANYNFLNVSGGENNAKHHSASPDTDALNNGFILMKKPEMQIYSFSIVKGAMGFGFTIADSAYGQKVKKILDFNCCTELQEGDVLLEINGFDVRKKSHLEVVQILKDCSKTEPTHVKIQRGSALNNSPNVSLSGGEIYSTVVKNNPLSSTSANHSLGNVAKLRKNFSSALFRSKTPTADLYSTQQKEIPPIRPKTPLVDTRGMCRDDSNDISTIDQNDGRLSAHKSPIDAGRVKSTNILQEIEAISENVPFLDPFPKSVASLSERLAGTTLHSENIGHMATDSHATNIGDQNVDSGYHRSNGLSVPAPCVFDSKRYDSEYITSGVRTSSGSIYGMSELPSSMNNYYTPQRLPTPPHFRIALSSYSSSTPHSLTTPLTHQANLHHHRLQLTPPSPAPLYPHSHSHSHPHGSQYSPASLHTTTPLQAAHIQNERMQKRVNELLSDRRRVGFAKLDTLPQAQSQQQWQAPYCHQPPTSHMQHSPTASGVSQQTTAGWIDASLYSSTMDSSNGDNLPNLQRNGSDSARGAIEILDRLEVEQYELSEITLERQALGFGFRIVGGTEEGSQVTVGHIVPGGAADNDQRINTGDEILSIDGINVVNSSHHKVVSLMGEAALRGQVKMILRRRLRLTQQPQLLSPQTQPQQQQPSQQNQHVTPLLNKLRYPYDVIVSRRESESFGFVIISSSNQYYGSTIGKLISGSPADRCGELKVGDHIIAVNRINIAGLAHGDVVNLIKESGLHVRLTIGCPQNPLMSTATNAETPTPILHVNSEQLSPDQPSHTQLLYAPLPIQQEQQHPPQSSPNLMQNCNSSDIYYMEHHRTGTESNVAQQQQQQQGQH